MGDLNQQLMNFIFTATFWLQKVVFEVTVPLLVFGGLLLMFGRKFGWRIIWGTALGVFIALFAKPVVQQLPAIVSSVNFAAFP